MATTEKKKKRTAREIVLLVRAAMMLLSIVNKLFEAIFEQGGTEEDIHRLSTPAGAPAILEMAKCAVVKRATAIPNGPTLARDPETTVLESMGLVPLIERGVGPTNLANIHRDITPERFPTTGAGDRKIYLWVEPCRDGETQRQAAERLAKTHNVENTRELACYLHDHPEEVQKWSLVFALGEKSRWQDSNSQMVVPYARVLGGDRIFNLVAFRARCGAGCGVLVSSKSAPTVVGAA